MKWNIYSKLWMIFFVLMGAACTNQVEDAIPLSDQPIEFSVQSDWKEIPNTRSNAGRDHFDKGDTIQIFGFHKSSSGKVQKFMYRLKDWNRGQKVVLDDTGWNYSPKRFWPKEGKLDFYAGYPEYSVWYNNTKNMMTYKQDVNPLQLDLLWGVSPDHDCAKDSIDSIDSIKNVVINKVEITMKHALAKVNIKFAPSLGNITQAVVSAYKTGYFEKNNTDDGIPHWIVEDTSDIQEAIFSPNKDDTKIGDATVFILPYKITGLILTTDDGTEINASKKIQEYTFEAGKVYNLTISKGVQKKNTNSRSIAMSVRCVSE